MGIQLKEMMKKQGRPFIVAGPCSVESEKQVVETAIELAKEVKPSLLRGGIWKPRTRPDSFEGVGAIGLDWLVTAGKEAEIPVTTEVANTRHVEQALKAGVDVLWLGARTSVNPFTVQEIAEALKGTKVPVMIKNPINPDLNLWIGAIERFQKAGITDIVGIHRGFSVYEHPKYRNAPNWEIPIGLMEKMPEVPLLCDPSHICGNREDLLAVSQKSMDLNFSGLMVETHMNPDKAWSDAQQQITPSRLKELLDQLVLREPRSLSNGEDYLAQQRKQITQIDEQLFDLLKDRMEIAEVIGGYKRENSIMIFQSEHWQKIVQKYLSRSEELGLSKEFMRVVLNAIHQESIDRQNKVMNEE